MKSKENKDYLRKRKQDELSWTKLTYLCYPTSHGISDSVAPSGGGGGGLASIQLTKITGNLSLCTQMWIILFPAEIEKEKLY